VLVYVAIGNLGPAAADLGNMLAIRPNASETYLRRGRLHAAMKDHDKAIADFTKALELIPDDLEALFHRSLAHYAKGEYAEADRDLERIERLGVAVPPGLLQAVGAPAAGGEWKNSISRR
jgi:tetratricopeptide (TPR) repeat protein